MPGWDDLVIGSGLLGAIVARRLAEGGRRVAILERGRAVTDPPGSHLRNTPEAQADPDGYFLRALAEADFLDEHAADENLPGAFTTSIVGGSGILWTNNCPRSVAGVDRPDDLHAGEWERCYAAAEGYLQVRDDEFDDSFRAAAVQKRLGPELAEANRRLIPLPLSGRRTSADRIHYVGPADVLRDGPPLGHRAGAVDGIAHDEGRVVGVHLGGEIERAENVVVAAGAIDGPRLLWRSGIRPPALGRHLSCHRVLFAQVVLGEGLWQEGAELDPLPRLGIPPTPDRPWFTMLLRDTCPMPPSEPDLDLPENRLIELQAFAPVDPDAGNVLRFAEDGGVHFDIPLSDGDHDRIAAIERDAAEICATIGRFRAGCEPQWIPPDAAHLTGSCRMGAPGDGASVTDSFGQVHGVENLFLATNGLISTRLAVNPTLTAAALAVRTADRILSA